jgi:predicted ATPase/class 3 adenylate cyclase/Tfp pilus assembly protein PilF
MPDLPTGAVTFFFTDIEGSTRLWEQYPAQMRSALARHDALAAAIIAQHYGILMKHRGEGDSLFAVFAHATDAVAAACALQQAFVTEQWPAETPLRVRLALHTGEADLQDGDYYGAAVNRCARLRAIGHGEQVLLSLSTEELVRDQMPDGANLRPLGLHRLRDLTHPEQVFQLLHPGLRADFPALRSLNNPSLPNNLPIQVTSFIGRERELVEVSRLLASTRLLTLVGTGGCGKTRLALQVAAGQLDRFTDGVWLVELAPLSDPALVPQTVATALNLHEEPGKPLTRTLTEYLNSRTALLLLDNCEHLLTPCAQLAETLMRSCPNVCILASSREGLGIAGELTYRVQSLSVPDPKQAVTAESLLHYDAVRLFVERAVFHQPAFIANSHNASALAQVCHRLDGIPLAIELAAARVRSLAVEEINARLDNRFRLLTGGSRTALPRQQTLRALIDWSYDLLTAQERLLLHRVSVFLGGWTLEAAEQVAGDWWMVDGNLLDSIQPTINQVSPATNHQPPITAEEVFDLLTSLVDKSLVLAEQRSGRTRYRLFETIRQYARDKLMESGETVAVRGRHRDYFLAFAQEADTHLWETKAATWLDLLEAEHDNLRMALQWCRNDGEDARLGLRLASSLWQFWHSRGYWSEGREFLMAALAQNGAEKPTPARAKALNGAGRLAGKQGDYRVARTLYEESLSLYEGISDQAGTVRSLRNLGYIARRQGDYAAARSYYEQALRINREIGSPAGEATTLFSLGWVAAEQGDYSPARAYFQQALEINRNIDNQDGQASNLYGLGLVARFQGDYAGARSCYEQASALHRLTGNREQEAYDCYGLGWVAREQGDFERARACYEQALAIHRELGIREGEAYNLNELGQVIDRLGDHKLSCALLEQALVICRSLGNRETEAYTLSGLGLVTTARSEFTRARSYYEQALEIYRAVGNQGKEAANLTALGNVIAEQQDYEQAHSLQVQALEIRCRLRQRREIIESLEAFASLYAAWRQWERAARLYGAAASLRASIGAPFPPCHQEAYQSKLDSLCAAFGVEGFAAAQEEGGMFTLEQAIACALGENAPVIAYAADDSMRVAEDDPAIATEPSS